MVGSRWSRRSVTVTSFYGTITTLPNVSFDSIRRCASAMLFEWEDSIDDRAQRSALECRAKIARERGRGGGLLIDRARAKHGPDDRHSPAEHTPQVQRGARACHEPDEHEAAREQRASRCSPVCMRRPTRSSTTSKPFGAHCLRSDRRAHSRHARRRRARGRTASHARSCPRCARFRMESRRRLVRPARRRARRRSRRRE